MVTNVIAQAIKTQVWDFDFRDLNTVAATTKTFTLKTLPPGAKVLAAASLVVTACVGITTPVAEIGDGSDPNEYLGQDDISATAGTCVEGTPMYDSIDMDGNSPVILTFTSGSENWTSCTAGQWRFQVTYLDVPVPAS